LVTNDGTTTRFANEQRFTTTGQTSQVVTTHPTNVDNPPGSATLNGYVQFPNGSAVEYYYEYIPNCDLDANVTATFSQTLIATGSPQTANGVTINNLSPGLYCYRIVGQSQMETFPKYGQYVPFVIARNLTIAVTLPAVVNGTCVLFNGTANVTPAGTPVAYYFNYGASLDVRTYKTVSSTPLHTSPGFEVAQAVQVCGLAPGQYYYELMVVINPGTPQERTVYGALQPFQIVSAPNVIAVTDKVRQCLMTHAWSEQVADACWWYND